MDDGGSHTPAAVGLIMGGGDTKRQFERIEEVDGCRAWRKGNGLNK